MQGKVHSPTYRMAMEEDCCAVVHPAKLARGLADVVVAKGVSLFERVGTAAMTDEGARVRVDTSDGPIYGGQGSSPPTPGPRASPRSAVGSSPCTRTSSPPSR